MCALLPLRPISKKQCNEKEISASGTSASIISFGESFIPDDLIECLICQAKSDPVVAKKFRDAMGPISLLKGNPVDDFAAQIFSE